MTSHTNHEKTDATEEQADPCARRCRWCRYGLRSLLVFVLLVSVLCGWVAVKMRLAKRQGEAVDAIVRSGGMVLYDHQIDVSDSGIGVGSMAPPPYSPWLVRLFGEDFFANAVCARITADSDVRLLGNLSGLRWLSLSNEITDQGLLELQRSAQPEFLFISQQLTSASVKHLKKVSGLRTLIIADRPVSGAELALLAELPQLRGLWVWSQSPRLDPLKKLRLLRKLRVRESRITDTGLSCLAQLPELHWLDLSCNSISDRGLRQLQGLSQLESLDLSSNEAITDAGLGCLKGLSHLKKLHLIGTGVTENGLRKLKDSLPDCTVNEEKSGEGFF